MQRFLYSLLFTLATPLILLRLYLRSMKAPAYSQRIGERFGRIDFTRNLDDSRQLIWIHAVSVGETNAAAGLVRKLLSEHENLQILLTTMTPTGSVRVRELFGNEVLHSYIPYDLPWALNKYIKRLKPVMLILMETELWPNLIHICHKRAVKLVLANGRLSDRSANGYRRFADMTRSMLERVDHIAAQSKVDAQRFIDLGADPRKVSVTGSLKFHIAEDVRNHEVTEFFASIKESNRLVVIAASTRDGEEEKVLAAFRKCIDAQADTLLILVPRHPERFDQVVLQSEEAGFNTLRRSTKEAPDDSVQVMIGDSMGEMLDYYSAANIAFVGGSLVDTGCQNVLEPAAMGMPIIVGPSQYNFATICAQLEEAGALKTVSGEKELASSLIGLMSDPQQQQTMGRAGAKIVAENQQALPALIKIVDSQLKAS